MKRFAWISLALLLVCYAGFGWYLSGVDAAQSPWLMSTCALITRTPAPSKPNPMVAEVEKATESERAANREEAATSTAKAKRLRSPEAVATPAKDSEKAANREEATTSTAKTERPRSPEAVATPAKLPNKSNFCRLVIQHNMPAGLIAVGWIFLSSLVFISPLSSFNRFISRWFQSDTVAFATIFLLAGTATMILYWLHIVLQILTVLAAEALARIDIQVAGMTGLQAYWILTVVSLTGLMVGWLANGVL